MRARGAGPKQPEKMVGGRGGCKIARRLKRRSPPSVSLAGFVDPGSYLLSRDLSSDYHRRADVSLPGSEWDRVGPSGYDHQASGSVFLSVCQVGRAARCCLLDAQAG